ncbi:fungal specific transcription factor [Aspergillus bombycis]|uniref:Fungal specific transcription factor n=1 Tax=Aspergillus bombycis TaxID=109264 RepID=A0A1F8AAH6_9EURO|nr:fungal specific transcription factor [Aspergillus bombycis]OGM48717.1 fungal specific transcription factor [Aspergillus bombycis]
MDLTFHISQDGKVPKRSYARGACERCRLRKKKCYHQKANRQSAFSTPQRPTTQFVQYSPATTRGSQSPRGVSASQRLPGAPAEPKLQSAQQPSQVHIDSQRNASQISQRDTSTHRFIGDLNPVVLFVDDGSMRLMRGRAHQQDVGVWLDGENEFIEKGENASHEERSSSNTRYQVSRSKRHSGCAGPLLPPRQTQEALINIYFHRIHPMLPLVHEEDFQMQFRNGTVSLYLVQAICLVASKERDAEPLLQLGDRTETIPPRKFSDLLYDDLCYAITMRLERKRMALIQTLALASLHTSRPKSFEDASLYLAQAIHHAHTVGLHFLKCGPERHEKPLVTLFWCLWSLDRWTAAIHGRPLVIHDRDLGQQLTDVIDLFDSPFRVWLSLASIMGEVMVVYRPMLDAPVDENKPEIPRFEELIAKCQAENIPLDQMLSFELAYHAIALLASRPWGLKAQPRSHALYLRQDLAVYRIATLIQMCAISQFAPLPTVAYSISLAFSISYKQLKRCQLLSAQHAAKKHLQTFYKSLEALSSMWWSAQVMTRLGQRALDGMQRLAGRTSQLAPPYKKGPIAAASSSCDACDVCSFHSEGSSVAVAEAAHDQQLFENEAVAMTDHQPLFDFGDLDDSGFNDFVADPIFQDIDDQLGNFLNITIPKCPSDSAFINPDTMWNPDEFDFSCH